MTLFLDITRNKLDSHPLWHKKETKPKPLIIIILKVTRDKTYIKPDVTVNKWRMWKQKEDKNRDEVMQKTLEYEGNSWKTAYAYGASHPRQRQIIIKFNSIKTNKGLYITPTPEANNK